MKIPAPPSSSAPKESDKSLTNQPPTQPVSRNSFEPNVPPLAPQSDHFDSLSTLAPSRNNTVLGIIGTSFFTVVALTTPFIYLQLRSPLPYMATPSHKVKTALEFICQRIKLKRNLKYALDSVSSDSPSCLSKLPKTVNTFENDSGICLNRFNKSPHTTITANKVIHDSKLPKKLNFVDLGSGDGSAVFCAASLGWDATGVELNPTLWILSSLRRLLLPRNIRARSSFILGDMFAVENVSRVGAVDSRVNNVVNDESNNDDTQSRVRYLLNEADCIMIFGVKSLMPKIRSLIQNECREGSYVMSYRFHVPLFGGDPYNKEVGKKIRTKKGHKQCHDMTVSYGESVGNGTAQGARDGTVNRENNKNYCNFDVALIYEHEEMRIYQLNRNKQK